MTVNDASPVCPLSGTPMRPWLHVARDWRRPDEAQAWHLWWSDAARYGEIHPRPDAAAIARFYEMPAYYTHTGAGQDRPLRPAERVLAAIACRLDRGVQPDAAFWRAVVPPGARRALEIGTGNGDRLVELAPLVETCLGLEPDPQACATARAKGLDVHEGTAEAIPPAIAAHRHDFILFSHVLEHCLDPLAALANAAALLSETGVLVVETPNNAAAGLALRGPFWRWLDVPRHLNFFTEQSLRAAAERAGLRVERVEYWGYCRQFLADWIDDELAIEACLRGVPADRAMARRQYRQRVTLLARTALANPATRYDSVRLICRRA